MTLDIKALETEMNESWTIMFKEIDQLCEKYGISNEDSTRLEAAIDRTDSLTTKYFLYIGRCDGVWKNHIKRALKKLFK